MEQIQFIYFQDYMQYYTVHHKENTIVHNNLLKYNHYVKFIWMNL